MNKNVDKDNLSHFLSSSNWHEMSKESFIKKLNPPVTLSPPIPLFPLPYLLLPLSTMAEVLGYSSPPCLYGWAGG